ncbi:hypothetical protein JHK82_036937 [Glycine max]|nr:hypothetical protein JHK85_037693 [Glycine max]KAG5113668.1 hypothetical protein JHK82_036937 [Glycine max]
MSFRKIVEHFQYRRGTLSSFSRPLATHSPQPAEQNHDPHSLMKQDPIEICTSLWVKTFSSSNLTGFLSNFDLWLLAYQRSCAHATGTFPPRNAVHTPVLHSLRNAVIRIRFEWNDKTNPLFRAPNDAAFSKPLSKRKLRAAIQSDKPCFQDRVVQEILLMILEPVFEPRFSPLIARVSTRSKRPHWDLTEFLDRVDPNVVMRYLEKGTRDKKILGLIKSALDGENEKLRDVSLKEENVDELRRLKKRRATKKRILKDNEPKPDPYWLRTFFSFSPEEAAKVPDYGHCGILSPLLANVCLNELDHWMEEKIVEFFRPCAFDSIWKHSIHNPA